MKLYSKVLLSMMPVMLLSAQAIIVYSKKAVHAVAISRIEKRAVFEVEERIAALTHDLARLDEYALMTSLQDIAHDSEAAAASVTDERGVIVAHTNVAQTGRVADDPFIAAALAAGAPLSHETASGETRTLVLIVPIHEAQRAQDAEDFLLTGGTAAPAHGRSVGAVRLEIPLAEMLVLENRIGQKLLWIVCLCNGLAAGVLILLIRRVLSPIRLLLDGTEKIRLGERGATIVVDTRDEIGELARSFNAMSLDLAATTVSKDFFNNILETMQDPLIVTDAQGRITLVNPAVPVLAGASAEELVGGPAAALIEGGAALLRVPQKGLRSAQFLRRDGTKTPILFSHSPLRDANGATLGYVIAAKDISEIKKLEGRMQQSEKLSAVGQLAAGVAHEINNPLGVILGFSQGMARQLKAGDPLELPIKSIEREALRCKNLVQDLLTFARTSKTDREGMSLNQAIEQALSLVETQVKMGRVELNVDLGESLPMILGNKNQIQQVILNLAKNALDAMPNGGTLEIKTFLNASAPHSWVCLEIADTGSGIPEAIQARVFEPFFTTKPVGQGTGLGLSLVSEIVKKHSGEIDVESAPGRTVFRVLFPARTGREIEEKLTEQQREKLAAAPAYRK